MAFFATWEDVEVGSDASGTLFFLLSKSCSGGLQVSGGGQGAPATLPSEVCRHPGIPRENEMKGKILTDSPWCSCRV